MATECAPIINQQQLSFEDMLASPGSVTRNSDSNILYFPTLPYIKKSSKGIKKEVYAFKDPADLIRMQKYFHDDCSSRKNLRLRNWLFFTLGINMGFRVSDLCRLQWKHIFLPDSSKFNLNDWNELTEEKTGKRRQVVINTAAQKAVSHYLQSLSRRPETLNQDEYVFWSNKKSEPHVQPKSMHRWIKEAALALSIPFNVGTHSMRKTFGYMLYNATNKNIGLVQHVLNHSSERMTLRYIGIDHENVRAAYNTVPDVVWIPEN